MPRFATEQKSLTQSINTAMDTSNIGGLGGDVPKTTTSFSLTATEAIGGVVRLSTQAAINVTTPSAAALVAALPNAQVGSSFETVIVNGNSGTATMLAGAGVTLVGTTTALTNTSRTYRGMVTNATAGAEAVTFTGLQTGPV